MKPSPRPTTRVRRSWRGLRATVPPATETAVLGFLALKCAVLSYNLVAFPVLCSSSSQSADLTGVSLLVPVRDEESNLRRTLAGFLAQPVGEVLLLDDGSTDGTAELVRAAAAADPRVRLLAGAALPSGWGGKSWACHQLASAATGEVLVFCDADVTLTDGALAAVLTEADQQEADVFSVFPRQSTGSLGERTLLPLIDDVLLCLLPHALLRQPLATSAATANGQLLAFRRAAYTRLGGHEAVRSSLIEDVRFARMTRRAGLRLGLALGGDLVSVRMYDGYAALVAGFGRTLLPAHGGSRALMGVTAAWHLLAYTAPWLRAVRHPSAAALAPVALAVMERVGVNAKTGRSAWWEAALVPLAPVAALPVYARAARRARVWKGRTYP